MRTFIFLFVSLCLTLSAAANFRNAQSLREAMQDKQTERWGNVPDGQALILCKRMAGNRVVTYHEPVRQDGKVVYVNHVDPNLLQQRLEHAAGIDPRVKRQAVQGYAQGMDMVMGGIANETGGMDPGLLMGMQGMGQFLNAAAPSSAELAAQAQERNAQRQKQIADLDQFFRTATIKGTEVVSGRECYPLHSSDAGGQVQHDRGVTFEPQSADLWIDKEELVQVKMKITGKLTEGGKPRQMVLEMISDDFRTVNPLFVSHHEVSMMKGLLNKKQQKQMDEAKKQLAEFRRQFDAMPPNQQAMIQQMMGPKMEQLEKMVSSGGIEMETFVDKAIIGGLEMYAKLMGAYMANLPLDQVDLQLQSTP